VASKGMNANAYVSVVKPERNRLFGRIKHRGADDIKLKLNSVALVR
jgi:hypothetical protein